ncbi:MAG: 2-phosphosulfolactate phosphatase [Ignavibacteriales bacterium]|nr:2-phosphosulfolactate phosphatase [Ignavibacteriales bacterium]
MKKTVVIDALPESIQHYREDFAVVVIDVIRATTTAVTAVAMGRRCFPVPTVDAALARATKLHHPLFVGELGGNMPYGFDMTNSPAGIARRRDMQRPMILLSSSGTTLLHDAAECHAVYLACFRNQEATAAYLRDRYERIALIGAGTRGESREEDQMCAAWIAGSLLEEGFTPGSNKTLATIKEWKGALPSACHVSKSVDYLRRTGQVKDLTFILSHIDDLHAAYMFVNGEVLEVPVHAPEPEAHQVGVSQERELL